MCNRTQWQDGYKFMKISIMICSMLLLSMSPKMWLLANAVCLINCFYFDWIENKDK